MNKTIKKMVALGIGATMLAGTAAVATAATLADYPSPFVKDGAFAGKIVFGSTAAVADVIGAIDIATSLQVASSKPVTTGGSTASVSNGVSLNSGSDQVYLGVALDEQRDTITSEDLPELLADETFTDDDSEDFEYEQTIKVGTSPIVEFSTSSNDLDDPELILQFSDDPSTPLYTFELTFDEAVDFDDETGGSDASEGQKIMIFGKEYTVGTKTDNTYLHLLGGATDLMLTPGEEQTITFNGKEVKIKLVGVNDNGDEATIVVNGDSEELDEGQTKKVGGIDIYMDTVSAFNTEANPGWVKIMLGAQELWLSDGTEVEVGSSKTAIDGTEVSFTGTTDALTKIEIAVAATDDDVDFLKAGDEFVDPVFGNLKVNFAKMVNAPEFDGEKDKSEDRKLIKFSSSNDETLGITFEDASGNDITLDWADKNGGAVDLADKDGNDLLIVEGATLAEDNYYILNSGNYQHLIEITKVDLTDDSAANDKVYFKDLATGTTHKVEDKDFGAAGDTTTITISGQTYTIKAVSAAADTIQIYSADYGANSKLYVYPYLETVSGKDHRVAFTDEVTITGADDTTLIELPTGTLDTSTLTLTIADAVDDAEETVVVGSVRYIVDDTGVSGELSIAIDGGQDVDLTDEDTNAGFLFVEEEDNSDSDTMNAVYVSSVVSGAFVELNDPVFTGTTDSEQFDNTDYKGYLTTFGTYYLKDASDDDQTVGQITYPAEQMYAQVFVTPLDSEVITTSTGGAVAVTSIPPGMAIEDTEATLGSKPYIVVGGPCINTVAAALMGNPTDCAEGFEAGKATIKLFSDKNALLVAGYSAKDTQGATKVLAQYKNYKDKFVGTELEVVTTNLNSLQVTKVQ